VELDSNVERNKRKKLILLSVSISVASTIITSALWLIIKKWRRNRGKLKIYCGSILVVENFMYF
jgi:hypothetical protein